MSEDGQKLINVMRSINALVKDGIYEGDLKCPFCEEGKIHYIYENDMAMRAKCDKCNFKLFA